MPQVRADLVSCLERLADESRSSWKPGQLDCIVHFLFDDSAFAEDPSAYIGEALVDRLEVDAVSAVVRPLSSILRVAGPMAGDSAYLESSEWPVAVAAAKRALAAMTALVD